MNSFIVYGAGKKGRAYLQFLKKHDLDHLIHCFCDVRASEIRNIENKAVVDYEEARSMDLAFIIGVRNELQNDIVKQFQKDNVRFYTSLDEVLVNELHFMDRTEFEREFCAVSHIDTMDGYFDSAELPENIGLFWSGIFRDTFNKLDLDSVVEIACGRGRHVPHYCKEAGRIVLVDILEKNIRFCRNRFSGYTDISYVINNGYDLAGLSDASFTSVFSYDAMVHFELLDIANYLKETYRVLKPGGRALFHHSNNYSDYKASYSNAVASRSFMSDKIFGYLAYRCGFEVLEQHLIDWENVPGLDCLTLLAK